jgi:hypothetical protein
MDLSSLANFIKQKLLEGWVLTCCVKDCVEPLKQFTEVIYVYEGYGLALVKKSEDLKRFLEVSDEEFEKLRIILYNPSFTKTTGLCYTENWVSDKLDEEEAEHLARVMLENIRKAERLYLNTLFPV